MPLLLNSPSMSLSTMSMGPLLGMRRQAQLRQTRERLTTRRSEAAPVHALVIHRKRLIGYCARCEVVARTCMQRYILTAESGTTLLTVDRTMGGVARHLAIGEWTAEPETTLLTTDRTPDKAALGPNLAVGPPHLTMLNHIMGRDPRRTRGITLNMSEVHQEAATSARGAQDLHGNLRLHAVARRLHVRRVRKEQAGPLSCATIRQRWFRTTRSERLSVTTRPAARQPGRAATPRLQW